ncbi:hypothetical protein DPMN_131916 [Dreissena polymorpha]|uniref:Uncharacterized protein n=1 Tax=Dreissena polymorpha TaxID=45954 RepID=A0A9D4FRI2_DREPO|nr:hypothetical protein DPMN_131916 [Dreissena polymorpha]
MMAENVLNEMTNWPLYVDRQLTLLFQLHSGISLNSAAPDKPVQSSQAYQK